MRVDLHANLARPSAGELGLEHTADGFDVVLERFTELFQLLQIDRPCDGHDDDWEITEGDLANVRIFGVLRQLALGAADPVTHLLQDVFDFDLRLELERNHARTLSRGALHFLEIFQSAQLVFERDRDE